MLKTEQKKKSIEPQWLAVKRLAALVAYDKEPLPDKVSHLWKYSDPAWFDFNPQNEQVISSENIKTVFNLEQEFKNKGVALLELSQAFCLEIYKGLILETYSQHTSKYPSRFTYFNDALWSSGYFLYVPKGVKIEKPITIKLLINKSNKIEVIRNLIILEEEASISLIDEISSDEESTALTNTVTEVFLAKGAKLNCLNLQTNNKNTIQHFFQRVELKEHSEFTNLIVALGGKTSKTDLGASLNGHGASIIIYGIVLGEEAQRFDHHTTIEHIAPHTKSALNFRVALKDKARSAYTGNLKIAYEAVKSDAHQENRNLLLSSDAKAESIPELEILTNDVIRCNHGVTVSQVDKDQIYYLTSRGLDPKEAERIIIEGFFEPTISRIPDKNLKEEISNKIYIKLENVK